MGTPYPVTEERYAAGGKGPPRRGGRLEDTDAERAIESLSPTSMNRVIGGCSSGQIVRGYIGLSSGIILRGVVC